MCMRFLALAKQSTRAACEKLSMEFLKNMYCVIRGIHSQASAAKLTDCRRDLHIRKQNPAKSRSCNRTHGVRFINLADSYIYTQPMNGMCGLR